MRLPDSISVIIGIMKLTVVSQLFYPELISTGLTLTELCEGLAKGVKVTVIAGYPTIVDTKVPKRLIHKESRFTGFGLLDFEKLIFLVKPLIILHFFFQFSSNYY